MNINTLKYIEEYVKIRDKSGKIIPLKLNKGQQKLYNIIREQHKQNKPIRIIVLKARQIGFSTLTEAVIFKNTATKPNVNSGIITHKEDATTNLFNMSKRMYDNLPDALKPQIQASNAKELIFDNKDRTGLGSKIKCMTAGGDGVGRSDTFTNLHISELAFWKGDKKETLTGLLQAVPNLPNTMVVIESTANGFDYFKELWDMAVRGESDYIPLFVGWNELEDYQMKYDGFELTEEEKELKEKYELSNEQIAWRRHKIKNDFGGDVNLFKQEYPINPEEAFLTTGLSVFDKEKIIEKLQDITKPLKKGFFVYDYDGVKIENVRWKNDPHGYIRIYETPNLFQYAIGGDTAGAGEDNFTAVVVKQNGQDVAVLEKKHISDEEYTRQIYCLGLYYKWALIGIEVNFNAYANKELERLNYPNLYVRESVEKMGSPAERYFGFRTDLKTRPLIISEMKQMFNENPDTFVDENLLREMLTFVYNEKGKPEAQQGFHDDLVMAKAIALHIRHQISVYEEVIEVRPEKQFSFEEYGSEDDYISDYEGYGEETVII